MKLFYAILAMFLIFAVLWSQDIAVQYFQNTDDIKESYNSGDLTYDQYVELLQLIEEKIEVNTGNLRRLLIIPGVEREDIEALEAAVIDKGPFTSINQVRRNFMGDFGLIKPFITVVPPVRIGVSGYTKIYTSRDYAAPSDDSDPYHKCKLYVRYGDFSAQSVLRQKGDNTGTLNFRSVEYRSKGLNVIVGNYSRKELGYGLMVGRNMSLASSQKDNDGINYLHSPYYYYGDLNGLYLRWNATKSWRVYTALSGNLYRSSSQRLASAAISYYKRQIGKLGVVIYHGAVTDKNDTTEEVTYAQSGASIFSELKFVGWKLQSETGMLMDGTWGTQHILYSPRRGGISLVWKFWAYHKDFKPLYSYGECDRRSYQSFYPDSFSFYLKSYVMGEVGSYASLRFPLAANLTGMAKFLYFNIANSPDNGGEAVLGAKYSPKKRGFVNIYLDRRWEGWGPKGDTWDKIVCSSKLHPFPKLSLQNYSYFRWVHYEEGNWKNGFKVSETAWFQIVRGFQLGLRGERTDYNIDDPEYGYWGVALTPHINIKDVNWKTEFSFRKYDDSTKWSLQLRVSALVAW